MENGYNKRKLLEVFGALESEIRGLEEETRKTLQEKQRRDGKQKELRDVERDLSNGKRLEKQAADIDRLLSYAGKNTQFGRQQKERVAKLEGKRDRLERAVEAYGNREQTYMEAVATDQCLRLYRSLCKQMKEADGADGNVQEGLKQGAAKYLQRKDALGLGIRLLGLSEGVGAVVGLFADLPGYIKITAEMLADYTRTQELEPQEKGRLNNVLATLYMWLIVLGDTDMAPIWFGRLESLQLRWDSEECPVPRFERFYGLKRQNEATPAVFRLLGFQERVDAALQADAYTAIDAVKEYLEEIESGRERTEGRSLDYAKKILCDYIQLQAMGTNDQTKKICVRLEEATSKLREFRGRPYFKKLEESVSAAANAYYDDQYVRQQCNKAYRNYLEAWMYNSLPKEKNNTGLGGVISDLAKEYPLDELEREIENCKRDWVLLEPDAFQSRMDEVRDEKKQVEVLQHIVKKGTYGEESEIILNYIMYGIGHIRKLSLKWRFVAVLVPINLIPMALFEFVLVCRSVIAMALGKRGNDEEKQWIGRANRRLNLIAAASMTLFYFTGGYGVREYYGTLEWLDQIFSPMPFLLSRMTELFLSVGAMMVIPYFVWTTFLGLFELWGDIRGRNVKR